MQTMRTNGSIVKIIGMVSGTVVDREQFAMLPAATLQHLSAIKTTVARLVKDSSEMMSRAQSFVKLAQPTDVSLTLLTAVTDLFL